MSHVAIALLLTAPILLAAPTGAVQASDGAPPVQYRMLNDDDEVRIYVDPPPPQPAPRPDTVYVEPPRVLTYDLWYRDAASYWQQYGQSRGYGQLKEFTLKYDEGKIEGRIEYKHGKIEIDEDKVKFHDDD